MKVLNTPLKCYIKSSYKCIVWKLQTHKDKSWSDSILDKTFIICIYLYLTKIIKSLDSSLRHNCLLTYHMLYKLIDNLRAASLLLNEGQRDLIMTFEVAQHVSTSISSRHKHFFNVQRNKELKEWPGMDLLRTCHHIFLDWCFILII